MHVTIEDIVNGVYPFLAMVLQSIALFYIFPPIGLCLPHCVLK